MTTAVWASGNLAILILGACTVSADIHYTRDGSASPVYPYTNWTMAADSLDAALGAAAPGDEVWVAGGIYYPTNRQTGFIMKDNLSLYGGFRGDETNRWQRDSQANPTILNGDMDRNDQTNAAGYVESALSTNVLRGSNSYHVLSWSGRAGITNILDRLIVTAGHGRDDDHNAPASELDGAGVYATGFGSLALCDCLVVGNRSGWAVYGGRGGGIYTAGNVIISNCTIRGNGTGSGILEGGSGGGVWAVGDLIATDSIIAANATGHGEDFEGHGGSGGGFLVQSQAVLRRCQVAGNTTGGCLAGRGKGGSGAGGYAANAVVVRDCMISGNACGNGDSTGGHGGGILSGGTLQAYGTEFSGNTAGWGTNSFNSGGGAGGGFFSMGTTEVVGCNVVSNSAGQGAAFGGDGGGFVCLEGTLLLSNTVVRANSAGNGGHNGGRGGGFYVDRSSLVIASTISHNKAGDGCAERDHGCGGGIYASDTLEVRNSLLSSNAAGNGDGVSDLGGSGGGICTYGVATLRLLGSTIVNNHAGRHTENGHGGGVYLDDGAEIHNSILSGNTVEAGSWGPDLCRLSGGPVNVYHSVVTDPEPNSINGTQVCVYAWSMASIGFVDPSHDDYELKYGSPCVNAGANSLAKGTTDLAGRSRIVDGTVDIGAYEYDMASADSNRDGVPDAWYVAHGLDPTNTSTGAANNDADPLNNFQEWVADTDPTNSQSYLCISVLSNMSSPTVAFVSSSNRVYTLHCCTNLLDGLWTNVPGQTNVPGLGGWAWLTDTNGADAVLYYRLSVSLP